MTIKFIYLKFLAKIDEQMKSICIHALFYAIFIHFFIIGMFSSVIVFVSDHTFRFVHCLCKQVFLRCATIVWRELVSKVMKANKGDPLVTCGCKTQTREFHRSLVEFFTTYGFGFKDERFKVMSSTTDWWICPQLVDLAPEY